jgi:hypothetical protein
MVATQLWWRLNDGSVGVGGGCSMMVADMAVAAAVADDGVDRGVVPMEITFMGNGGKYNLYYVNS